MSVCFLEVDDEITDAVARLRSAQDGRVVVVLPLGSRIGTSRINFRILAREAGRRGIAIALVSGDAGVRALAASAGMPSHGSVPEAEMEQALPVGSQHAADASRDVQASRPAAPGARVGWERTGEGADGARGEGVPAVGSSAPTAAAPATGVAGAMVASTGFVPGAPAGPGRAPGFAVTPRATTAPLAQGGYGDPMLHDPRALEEAERATERRHGRSRVRRMVGLLVRAALITAILAAAAYGAYLYLPTASIKLTPTTRPFGPLAVTVTADPTVAVADTGAGLVPAERVPIPLSATSSFPATGTQVNLIKATGAVRLTSQNTVTDVIVPDGTKLSTPSGIDFETTQPVTLPRATVSGTTITPSTANTPIRALKAGPDGNVDAGTIVVEPPILGTEQVQAINPQPTTGGKKTQALIVTRDDYDGAVQTLTIQLQSELAGALADPTTTPRGLTLYPETAELGKVTTDKTASDLVGSASNTFDLTAEGQSSALAVDQSQIATVAAKQLTDSAPTGVRVFADTVKTQVSQGAVNGSRIVFEVTATAEQYDPIDPAALAQQIHGKTVLEARSILAAYGSVEVSVWPDFIPTIPDDARRINLTIEDPLVSQ
jgi:hypothetical protein